MGPFLSFVVALVGGAGGSLLGLCGPFTDVAADAFCPFVLEIFYLGITTGTTATTYDPSSSVTRLQMAAFLSRSVDRVLRRGSRRAALGQFWTAQGASTLAVTTVGTVPKAVKSDGVDLWVAGNSSGTVSRVRGQDGLLLGTWSGATGAFDVVVAMNRVFVTGQTSPGALYRIDPTGAPGAVTAVATNLGNGTLGATFDGSRIWTANSIGGSVSLVTPGASVPWTVTTVTTGFAAPVSALFDGTNVWVTLSSSKLLKLDADASILQTVTLGGALVFPVYDGANIWVPSSSALWVVRASTGALLATLTGNGLGPGSSVASFDGERVLVTNIPGDNVSLWKAGDFSPLGSIATGPGTGPGGTCSDGVSFWVTLQSGGLLARF